MQLNRDMECAMERVQDHSQLPTWITVVPLVPFIETGRAGIDKRDSEEPVSLKCKRASRTSSLKGRNSRRRSVGKSSAWAGVPFP